jgi:tRNA G18 (ribose-2'-O)-methylase SpoU
MDKKTIWDLGRDTVEVFRAKAKMPLVVVLDNIRSLNNIGSVFRTSDAFLVERIMLCGITATPPSPEIHKTALGAEDSVEWQYFENTADCIARLREQGYTVCALEQVKGSIPLQDFAVEPGGRYALVAGHEVHGVSQEVVDMADCCIEIPQCGTKHSLNVSVSAALGIWHFFNALHLAR